VMGAAVGGMLIVTNVRTLLKAFGASDAVKTPVILGLIIASVAVVVHIARRERRLAAVSHVVSAEVEGAFRSATVAPASVP